MARTFAPTLSDVDYHPTGGNAYQRLDFYRRGTVAGVTFPVLIVFDDSTDGNFGGSKARPTELARSLGLPYFAYLAGFSVVWASYTVTDDALVGDGLFGAAEHAEKDATRVVQYVRLNAATLGIDTTRIFVYGIGTGATVLASAAFGPDVANPGSPELEERESSRVDGAVLLDLVANWDTALDSIAATHFSITPTDTLGDIAAATLDSASLLSYGDPLNAAVPFFLASRTAGVSTDYVAPFPTNSEPLGSAWNVLAAEVYLLGLDATFHGLRSEFYDSSDGIPSDASLSQRGLSFLLFEAGKLPAEETILRETVRRLSEIRIENGYQTDVERVYRYGDPDGDGGILPAIMVSTIDADYDDAEVSTREEVTLRIGLALKLEGWERAQERTSILLGDVRRRIQGDLQYGGLVDWARIVQSARVLASDGTGDRSGGAAELRIQYLEQVDDPFVLQPDVDGAGPY